MIRPGLDDPVRATASGARRACRRRQPPHICHLYEIGEGGRAVHRDGVARGRTLEDRLRRGAVPLADALQTALDVLSALTRSIAAASCTAT